MKIGIISDTHGRELRWQRAYDKYFFDADFIIHAGDVLYHGPRNPMKEDYNPAGLAERMNSCPIPIIITRGNCDSEVDEMVLNIPNATPYAFAFANGLRIVVTHGHLVPLDEDKDKLAKHLRADIFITGHIHTNVLEKRGSTVFLNPGSPSLSKRADERSTIAVLEDHEIKIFDLDSDEVLHQLNF